MFVSSVFFIFHKSTNILLILNWNEFLINTDLISVEKLLSTVDGIPSVPPSPPLGLGASAIALTSPSLTDEIAGGDP